MRCNERCLWKIPINQVLVGLFDTLEIWYGRRCLSCWLTTALWFVSFSISFGLLEPKGACISFIQFISILKTPWFFSRFNNERFCQEKSSACSIIFGTRQIMFWFLIQFGISNICHICFTKWMFHMRFYIGNLLKLNFVVRFEIVNAIQINTTWPKPPEMTIAFCINPHQPKSASN